MEQSYLLLGLYVLSLVFVILGIIFLIRFRDYENKRLLDGYNSLLFGVFAFALFLFVKVVFYFSSIFRFRVIFGYMEFLISLSNVVLVPLMVICFLVGIWLFREA